jgi:hypothetical protein
VGRTELIRHPAENGCAPLREGSRHSFYPNKRNRQMAPGPRLAEVDSRPVLKSCKQLGIEPHLIRLNV